jgi:hypothetical protein
VKFGSNLNEARHSCFLINSYIYGAPSKARNLTSYIYIWTRFLLGSLLLEPCISLIYA